MLGVGMPCKILSWAAKAGGGAFEKGGDAVSGAGCCLPELS